MASTERRYTHSSNHTSSTKGSRRSSESCQSASTAASSFYDDSPRPSTKGSIRAPRPHSTCYEETEEEEEDDESSSEDDEEEDYEEDVIETIEDESDDEEEDDEECSEDEKVPDLSPNTNVCKRSARETYSSLASSVAIDDEDDEDDHINYDHEEENIPPLPIYHHEIEEFNVRPSTPEDFAHLFPSMERLNIRHDDFTSDGNMNLRVDTVVSGRRKRTIQLFHMRMYDLGRREFSLRRYCRDSGREVCNSKRRYVDGRGSGGMKIQRSMSNAMRSLSLRSKGRRSSNAGSICSNRSRPGTSYSKMPVDEEAVVDDGDSQNSSIDKPSKNRQVPTNTLKLEFSNYARIDLERRAHMNSKRYEFEWWGHKYTWKRVVDKHTDTVSYHLIRDDSHNNAVAHIVPAPRSPNQKAMDEYAGGWVPPCHMWISDHSILTAMTDVADVIVATGLMALVDDCIKSKWQIRRTGRTGSRLSLSSASFSMPDDKVEAEVNGPRSLVRHLFTRRFSDASSSPLRNQQPVEAY